MILANSKIDKEVSEEGLNIVQSPAAITGANFHAPIKKGKFQGTICPTTPIGSCKIMDKYWPSKTVAEPSADNMQAAKYLKWCAAEGISTANVSLIGLPLSIDSILANFSLFCSIASAILIKTWLLCFGVVFFQVLKASQLHRLLYRRLLL